MSAGRTTGAEPSLIVDEDGHSAEIPDGAAFIVDLDGFEGPLDLLLTLARDQKLDLRQISMLELADQYLEYIAEVRRANLQVAAEYLVMAAWLAYLKSKLLLPAPPRADEPSAEAMAEALAVRLRHLDAIRAAADRLLARPQLGRDVFPRGRREDLSPVVRVELKASLYDLLKAYGGYLRRQVRTVAWQVQPLDLYSVEDALGRIGAMLGSVPGWEYLTRYLPEGTLEGLRKGELRARSAVASTFVASLELAKQGVVLLRQSRPFGPIAILAQGPVDGAADPDRK
jgi:Uncharacterized conserved protein